jgi:hypothetical protein
LQCTAEKFVVRTVEACVNTHHLCCPPYSQYREEDASQQATGGYPSNIMFDRRVVRGNTYAARILPADVSLTDTQSKSSTQ